MPVTIRATAPQDHVLPHCRLTDRQENLIKALNITFIWAEGKLFVYGDERFILYKDNVPFDFDACTVAVYEALKTIYEKVFKQ